MVPFPNEPMEAKCILVIDDEEAIRAVIQVCLEEFGQWNVLTARSGVEGLELATTKKPDAILLDVSMPGMDGFMTLQKLQENEHTQSIPVMFLTAHVQPEAQLEFSKLPIVGTIFKPFDPMALVEQVAITFGWESEK
jgi:two-component system, OmpR family, alkaline phosphatase synthesis response regulator PhoP